VKKHDIQVRNGDGSFVENIRRTLQTEAIGNFCPIFCQYKGARHLIESDALHVDDPFRAVESEHVGKLFIRPRNKEGRVVATWDEVKAV